MQQSDLETIASWIVQSGLAGASEIDLLNGFGERCCAVGVGLTRALVVIDTLHPIYEGRAFRWRSNGVEERAIVEYGSTNAGQAALNWRQSVYYHLLTDGVEELHRRIGRGETQRFPQLETARTEGLTDFFAQLHRFAGDSIIGEMDCVYAQWMSASPEGFGDAGIAALRRLGPPLALAIKAASLKRIASTLVEVYLGRDAGRRVLQGRISRGVAERINAVLWYSDLRSYTTITDSASPDEIIPLLNDYADAVISSIHEAGGDVLKLIGDGTLAIFKADDPADACCCALRAETGLRQRLQALNERRSAAGRPVTTAYLGLHIGDVFYGNIGSDDRLDFTVIGPAVNEVSRIASMCRSVDRHLLVSSDFAAAAPESRRAALVSVGRYALRGVGRAQDLFTLDPGML